MLTDDDLALIESVPRHFYLGVFTSSVLFSIR